MTLPSGDALRDAARDAARRALSAKLAAQRAALRESIYIPPREPLLVRWNGVLVPPFVAVAKSIEETGVYDGDDWTIAPGQPGNDRLGGAHVWPVMSLLDAIQRDHDTEAAQFSGVMIGPGPMPELFVPRVNKKGGGYEYVASRGYGVVFTQFCLDYDLPDHDAGARNTPETIEQWIKQFRALAHHPTFDGAGWSITRGGARIRYVPHEAVTDPDVYERIVTAQIELFSRTIDIQIDGKSAKLDRLVDWTRAMRLERIVRDNGGVFRSPMIDLSNLRPRAFDAPARVDVPAVVRGQKRKPRPAPTAYARPVETIHARLVDAAGFSPADHPGGERHPIAFAVGGALLKRQVPPEHVPAFVYEIALRLWCDSAKAERERMSAEDTVRTYLGGGNCTGLARLKRIAPRVAERVLRLAADHRALRLAESIQPDEGMQSADEAGRKLRAALDEVLAHPYAQHDVLGLGGPPGVGKTHLALEAIAAAPPGTRHLLLTATQRTADESQRRAHDRPVRLPMLRITSPLSERDENGNPVCIYHAQATALAEGGISASHAVCHAAGDLSRTCHLIETCVAAKGGVMLDKDGMKVAVDPSEVDVPNWIATHAAAVSIIRDNATSKLDDRFRVLCDEIPDVLPALSISEERLDATIRHLPKYFVAEWANAVLPALYAWREHLRKGKPYETDIGLAAAMKCEVPAGILAAAPDPDPIRSARMAQWPGKIQGGAPPVKREYLTGAREPHNARTARRIGRAAEVAGFVWRALREGEIVRSARIVVETRGKDEVRSLIAMEPSGLMEAIAHHDGKRVIMSADVETRKDEIAATLGCVSFAPVYEDCRDSAHIERRMDQTELAMKSKATRYGQFTSRGAHLILLDDVWSWLAERPTRKLVIGTWKPLAAALRYALATTDAERALARDQWLAHGDEELEQLADIAKIAEEIHARMPAALPEIAVMHFGANRGVDAHKDADAIVAIGDPWPHIGVMSAIGDLLGVDGDAIGEARAACELGQLFGRIRPKRRVPPARALYIGSGRVLPSGWATASPAVVLMDLDAARALQAKEKAGAEHGAKGGRPKMVIIDFADARARKLTQKQIAEQYGCDVRTVRRQAAALTAENDTEARREAG